MKRTILKNLINRYPVISFDIFDTLIERNVKHPLDIFRLTGKYILGEKFKDEFCLERKKAEMKARSTKISGEVTLDEIYEHLDKRYLKNKDQLKNMEIQLEIKSCKPKKEMMPYFDHALHNKREIYLISDMYLSSAVLETILQKCKITGYQKIYISNEYRKSKVKGNLFEQVIRDNAISKNNMLHIGDSIRADFIGAHKAGVHAFLIRRKNQFSRWWLRSK